jgi:hypothetical protein
MSNLCEAFNRINSKFGANRVKVRYCTNNGMRIQIVGLGMFNIGWSFDLISIECTECFWPSGRPQQIRAYSTPNSNWLEAIANGKVRDSDGNMVDPKNQVSKESKVWPEAC